MSTDFNDFSGLLDRIIQTINATPDLHSKDLPNIDLYMDQVTTFMDGHLTSLRSSENEKLLTKTMINNYTKNKLLPPPEKKKYSPEHMMVLAFIYYFKNVMSLQDIQSLFAPLGQNYFKKQAGDQSPDMRAIYDEIVTLHEKNKSILQKDLEHYRDEALASFTDAPEADRKFLQFFSLISLLCFDSAAKKEIIGQLIDDMMSS